MPLRFYDSDGVSVDPGLEQRNQRYVRAAQRHFAAKVCMRPPAGSTAPCECRRALLHATMRMSSDDAPKLPAWRMSERRDDYCYARIMHQLCAHQGEGVRTEEGVCVDVLIARLTHECQAEEVRHASSNN